MHLYSLRQTWLTLETDTVSETENRISCLYQRGGGTLTKGGGWGMGRRSASGMALAVVVPMTSGPYTANHRQTSTDPHRLTPHHRRPPSFTASPIHVPPPPPERALPQGPDGAGCPPALHLGPP